MNDKALLEGFKTIFAEGYDSVTPVWDQIAARVDSDGGSEEYGWLGGLAGMREMHGERMPQGLKNYDFTIKNVEFEESVRVKRSDLRDNKVAAYNNVVRMIGENYSLFPDEKVFSLLNGGFDNVSYDGQNFFDDDHVQGDGAGGTESFSNILEDELDATTYAAARAIIMGARNDAGKHINRAPNFLLVVGETREGIARALLQKEKDNAGADNVWFGTADLLVSPLVDNDKWFLLDVSSPSARPIVWQVREEVPFEAQEEGSHEDFFRKENFYGSYFRGNGGYGEYRKAVGSQVEESE